MNGRDSSECIVAEVFDQRALVSFRARTNQGIKSIRLGLTRQVSHWSQGC